MKKRNSKRQIRKATLKLKYLEEEYQDYVDEKDQGKVSLLEAVQDLAKKLGLEQIKSLFKKDDKDDDISDCDETPKDSNTDDDDVEKDEPSESSKKNAPDWVKRLYRKITMSTHPDRLDQMTLSDDEKEHRSKQYLKATQAVEGENYSDLIEIAMDLNIDHDDLPYEERLILLESKSEWYDQEIQSIKKMIEWQWFHADDIARKNILISFCGQCGYEYPSDLPEEKLNSAVDIIVRKKPPIRQRGERPISLKQERMKKNT